jgi:hypothetical protein
MSNAAEWSGSRQEHRCSMSHLKQLNVRQHQHSRAKLKNMIIHYFPTQGGGKWIAEVWS